MSTVVKNSRAWRATALVLVLIAILGPWTYERVYMPPSQRCPASYAHIEGDLYCSIPLPIFWEFFGLLRWDVTAALLTGDITFSQWAPQILFKILPLLLILPSLITLGLISRRLGSRWQVINAVAFALAALAGSAYLRRGNFRPYPAPWGNLLYVSVTLVAFVLELLVLTHSICKARQSIGRPDRKQTGAHL